MEINDDVVITGNVTVVGKVTATTVLSEQDIIAGRDYRFDGQDGKLIDNDSNARLTDVSAATLTLAGTIPTIPNATDLASAISSLNALLTHIRAAGTIA